MITSETPSLGTGERQDLTGSLVTNHCTDVSSGDAAVFSQLHQSGSSFLNEVGQCDVSLRQAAHVMRAQSDLDLG